MRFALSLAVCAALLATVGSRVHAEDAEESVPLDKLPQKVVAAVKAKWPKGVMQSASKETEDGKTYYEVALKDGDTKIEALLTEDGTIEEIEKLIAVKDLPKPVADAIASKYPKASVDRAEEITKGDKTSYEVLLTLADKSRVEVTFDAAGKVIEEEKKDGAKDKDDEKKEGGAGMG